ncbi:hypothetical protein N0V93_004922 [Gnomoniopsis smithogilvyi]|uniref:Uncharacterized protein n=1 Tax=Gnomoniopsis smithogilvyi TaxID=1191159 RepID=A0A9W8YTJ9_9PEZI|nr:hypothetical protein N0V93_004922 [Gnomoniopsis smithogilvyi]
MALRNLVDLPLEILQQIAGLVHDTHWPSFYALCITSKSWRSVCTPLNFQELRISVNDCSALQRHVDGLLKSLLSPVCGGDVTQYVRRLCIEGALSLTEGSGCEETTATVVEVERIAEQKEQEQQFRSKGLNELLDENEPLMDTIPGEEDPFVTPEQDAAWTPVVNLIKTLPNLTTLMYQCRNQLPPSLLNVLHTYRPQCRLYHHTFRLRSLRSKFGHIDPHEWAIATSPCLYSVKLRYSFYNEDAERDQNLTAILELLTGLAPNLKEVYVVSSTDIKYNGIVPEPHWTENVDPHANAKHIDAAVAFFDSLPPLRKLSVAGSILPEVFDTILSRHGPTVVDLKLCPFEDTWAATLWYIPYVPMTFTKSHYLQIKEHCHVLQSLSIYVKRTMSDPSEVELYASLARIKPLQFLFLTLDCSNWRVRRDPDLEDAPWFDEVDKEKLDRRWLKRGHVRQNLINCAVDETLARSIWDVIAKHKDGKRLLSLKLHTTGAMNFGWPGQIGLMADVARHLSRSWLIERGPRDDGQDALHVRELGAQARKARDQELLKELEDKEGAEDRGYEGVQTFRRIWPEREVGKPWIDDWKSYPLQT